MARKVSALRRYFHWLQRTGAITSDPSLRLSAPAGESRLPKVLGRTELGLESRDLVAERAAARDQVVRALAVPLAFRDFLRRRVARGLSLKVV